MKLPAIVLVASVAVNATLLGALIVKPTLAPPKFRSYFESTATRSAPTSARSGVVSPATRADAKLAPPPSVWAELGTDDLKLLVQRLLAAGFPPEVVRSVIVAEISSRYNRRYAELNAAAETKYWEANDRMDPNAIEARNRLARERMNLTRDVLGSALLRSAGDEPVGTANLPAGKADLVMRITQDYAEMAADIRAATRGILLPEDRDKLALLDREKHADLAAVLTPQELEDHEMRTSPTTSRLRTAMTLMDATEDEFRSIFRIYQKYDAQLNPFGMATGPTTYTSEILRQRQEAQSKVEEEVLAALGRDRGSEYVRSSNYEYQSLAQLAKRANLPADAAVRAFEIRDNAAQQSQQIARDSSLTLDQKRQSLQALAQDARTKLNATLGPTAGPAYTKGASWLQGLDRGSSVTFRGTSTIYSQLETQTRLPR